MTENRSGGLRDGDLASAYDTFEYTEAGCEAIASSMSHALYEALRADIVSFQIAAGMVLRENEVAERFGASRTPAREALRRLVQEGILVRSGRHYAVRRFKAADVRDLYEVREGLEKMAVSLAIERGGTASFEALGRLLAEQEAAATAGDQATFSALDTRFHLSIAQISSNALLLGQMRMIHHQVMLVRVVELSRPRGMQRTIDDHRRILDAMRRRDVTVAEAEMRYHMRSIVALYHGQSEPLPDGSIPEPNPPTILPPSE
jgi:GntR family transcriptional regulator, rspAB operon transcriptional repressor